MLDWYPNLLVNGNCTLLANFYLIGNGEYVVEKFGE